MIKMNLKFLEYMLDVSEMSGSHTNFMYTCRLYLHDRPANDFMQGLSLSFILGLVKVTQI